MNFKYSIKHVRDGESVNLKDGDIYVGANLVQDGQFTFHVVVHILERTDAQPLVVTPIKEITQ